jgi:hypothetical protein
MESPSLGGLFYLKDLAISHVDQRRRMAINTAGLVDDETIPHKE